MVSIRQILILRIVHGIVAKLVLASQSPRRRELLEMLCVEFETSKSKISEEPKRKEIPRRYVLRVAEAKARAAALNPEHLIDIGGCSAILTEHPETAKGARQNPGADKWILAADTAVILDGKIVGKPRDGADAERILSALSGKWHTVLTGVVLFGASGRRSLARAVSSRVKFREISPQEIRAYAETGEPMDKAGAYGIQGKGAFLVEKVSGSYTNVIGLPVKETREMLRIAGIL